MSMDLEEQYDKIYRYCYFKVHQREIAEDSMITRVSVRLALSELDEADKELLHSSMAAMAIKVHKTIAPAFNRCEFFEQYYS